MAVSYRKKQCAHKVITLTEQPHECATDPMKTEPPKVTRFSEGVVSFGCIVFKQNRTKNN